MRARSAADYEQRYGPNWEHQVVLVDHVGDAIDAGATLRVPENGLREYVVMPDGRAVPVGCGDIIEIRTEDGPSTGRCGIPIAAGARACPGHSFILDMSDSEFAQYERQMG